MRPFLLLLYLVSIAGANVVTASTAPLAFGPVLVPAGSFLIGAIFILRDLVQNAYGRARTYAVIACAMVLSAVTSWLLGDTLWIVFASAVTFLVSETTDTEIYTRLKLPLARRVLYSGLAGGTVDSVLFVLIGLSPLGAGFLPWEAVGYAMAGQVLVKVGLQAAAAAVIALGAKARRSAEA
ncbi:VUT family protein [Paenibacillus aurantius]|uniref:VUT family protein n=1 Tax=Paenibacillus aurantius TaxID=2918900 RepID=A0AA96REW5_9BACL|nr:VUT family protein [Paenibacillus aurantius]WNQ10841.1 VUT family protein [Paenibacillus aurantius]